MEKWTKLKMSMMCFVVVIKQKKISVIILKIIAYKECILYQILKIIFIHFKVLPICVSLLITENISLLLNIL